MSGLIPAYAGSTADWECIIITVRAHPRLRGDELQSIRRESPVQDGLKETGVEYFQTR